MSRPSITLKCGSANSFFMAALRTVEVTSRAMKGMKSESFVNNRVSSSETCTRWGTISACRLNIPAGFSDESAAVFDSEAELLGCSRLLLPLEAGGTGTGAALRAVSPLLAATRVSVPVAVSGFPCTSSDLRRDQRLKNPSSLVTIWSAKCLVSADSHRVAKTVL